MRRKRSSARVLFTVALGILVAYPLASGADPSMPLRTGNKGQAKKKEQKKVSPRDAAFLKGAAQQAMAHVQLAKEAKKQASQKDVKKFSKRIHKEQAKLQEELQSTAKNKGVQLPSGLDATHRKEMARLSKLKGEAFDKAYLEHTMKCTRYDMRRYRAESEKGRDTQLKRWSTAKLPVLGSEIRDAQQLHQKIMRPKPAMR